MRCAVWQSTAGKRFPPMIASPDLFSAQGQSEATHGELEEVQQYYHQYAVALLLEPVRDVC